jgi:hypothetical protein
MNETVKAKSQLSKILLVIGGFGLISIAVLGAADVLTVRFWRLLVFYFNPYYWQTWYAVNLWIFFIGALFTLLLKTSKIQHAVHAFYDSCSFRDISQFLKQMKINQLLVKFLIRRKFGKRWVRKEMNFFRRNRIENLRRLLWFCVALSILIVTFQNSVWLATLRFYAYYRLMSGLYYPYYYFYFPFYYNPFVEFHMGKITWKLLIAPATVLLMIVGLLRLNNKITKKRITQSKNERNKI